MQISIESPVQADISELIQALDDFQKPLYPAESHHGIDIEALKKENVIFAVARNTGGVAVACGAILLENGCGELKRMYTRPAERGQGIARVMLAFLEDAARLRGYSEYVLETGNRQADAFALYTRAGYSECGPFGRYCEDPHSIFMRKTDTPLDGIQEK